MRQKYTHVLFGIAVAGLVAGLGAAAIAHGNDDAPPSSAQVAFSQKVSDLMVNELVAALFQEFDETTPDNVEHGKKAISLIFNDLNRGHAADRRISTASRGSNDRPGDNFERTALGRALTGQAYTAVQKVNDTWFYRRSVPLSNTFHQACVLCHANFTADFFNKTNNPGQWVGALVVRIPIKSADDDQQ
jgi:hypothetical protein